MPRARATQTLTVNVDPRALRRARIRALERRTSINEVLGKALAAFADEGASAADPIAELIAVRARAKARRAETRPSRAPRFRREDLYER